MDLENLVKLKGYSQTELAKKCNVTKGHINQIIHGKSKPSLRLLFALANVLEIDIVDLLYRYKK